MSLEGTGEGASISPDPLTLALSPENGGEGTDASSLSPAGRGLG